MLYNLFSGVELSMRSFFVIYVKNNRILGHHISKNEIVFMEVLSFRNKTTRKKVNLLTVVTARERSESECLLQTCQI